MDYNFQEKFFIKNSETKNVIKNEILPCIILIIELFLIVSPIVVGRVVVDDVRVSPLPIHLLILIAASCIMLREKLGRAPIGRGQIVREACAGDLDKKLHFTIFRECEILF